MDKIQVGLATKVYSSPTGGMTKLQRCTSQITINNRDLGMTKLQRCTSQMTIDVMEVESTKWLRSQREIYLFNTSFKIIN
jgi:hypothetical protein